MFCKKCGAVVEDGKECCQACRQQDSLVWAVLKGPIETTGNDIKADLSRELQKAIRKKTKQVTRNAMKKIGLKKKTPLDKAKDMWKKMKR